MRLRTRLTLVSVLVLLIPVAVWQRVHSLERSLRQSHQATQVDTALALAEQLASTDVVWPASSGFYVHPAQGGFAIDGRAGEWEPWLDHAQSVESSPGISDTSTVIAAEQGRRLFLIVDVTDDRLVLGDSLGAAGDRLVLRLSWQGRDTLMELSPLAPGWFEQSSDDGAVRVQAALQPTERGWRMELVIVSASFPEALGLAVIDVDEDQGLAPHPAEADAQLRPLIRRSPKLAAALEELLPSSASGWIIGPGGWVLASRAARADTEPTTSSEATGNPLVTNLAAALLGALPADRGDRRPGSARLSGEEIGAAAHAQWYREAANGEFFVSAAAPLPGGGGHIVIERAADHFLGPAYRALLQVFLVALVGMLAVAGVTLHFGIGLSRRIRRLRNAAESAVSPDGRVRAPLAAPGGADEISELGRGLAAMIDRQHEHQEHLQALASRLSHELRTPLAMIRTSLDNLSEVDDAGARERYRLRAEAGCRRLQNTFDAMSQAARIEASLSEEPLERLDLGKLVDDYAKGCGQTFGTHRFTATVPSTRPAWIRGSGEQLAQLLDKLVENAVDFTPPGEQITLRVVPQGRTISLQVDNPGSTLPENLRSGQLFDSMTSSRKSGDERAHLGLGLHIVRLIAGRHDARCRAIERPGGVRFQVDFPRLPGAAAGQDRL